MHLLAKRVQRPIAVAACAVVVVVLAQLNIGSASAASATGLHAVLGGTTYLDAVARDNPTNLWRLNEATGATSVDSVGTADLTVDASATRGTAGPMSSETSTGTTFSGGGSVPAATAQLVTGPQSFSVEAWFKTTTTSGGKIVGLGNSRTANSNHYDRHIYMTNAGNLTFGVYPNAYRPLSSPLAYNNGQWHHVVGAMDSTGMDLFVDGRRVAHDAITAGAEVYNGYWRIGGDNLSGWPNPPTKFSFAGTIADVAIYSAPLTLSQVKAHYTASGRSVDPASSPSDAYGAAVYGDNPSIYWRLNETSGTAAKDESSGDTQSGTYTAGTLLGEPGSSADPTGKSIRFPGTSAESLASNMQVNNPTVFSLETWFKTTSNAGGRLIGFGNARTGSSSNYDRHIYMLDTGQLRYGIYSAQTRVTVDSPGSYNDGQWHQVVATQGPSGQLLYVDGEQVGTGTGVTPQNYLGYWRLGSDHLWSDASSESFAGSLDEAAVYPTVISASVVRQHYTLGKPLPPNVPPAAAFSSTVAKLKASFDASASADSDGTIATYAWDFGDGTSGTGVSSQHSYAKAGTYTVVLAVKDDKGATTLVSHDVTVTANTAPVAAFGSACTDLDCTFDASASADADGTIASYAWDFGDGTNATGATAAHSYASGGSRDVALTVTDDDGMTNTITQTVTVTPKNNPPTAALTGNCTDLDCTFDGTGSTDADGAIVSYAWDFGDGEASAVSHGTHSYAKPGVYTVILTVTDDRGGTGTASIVVTAVAPNRPPVAAFGAGCTNLVCAFDAARASDPDGSVTGYSWDFGDGTTGTGVTPSHTYAAGTYTVTLVVTDDDGATDTARRDVTAVEPNRPPVAKFTASATDLSVAVNAETSTDADGKIASYAWDFGDNTAGTGVSAAHTYAAAGTYTVTLKVTDDDGASDTVTHEVTAVEPNKPPVARFTSTAKDLSVGFNAGTSTDADGTIARYAWNFGDGSSGTGVSATHKYTAAGDYVVKLTVTDDDGATDTVSHTVTATDPIVASDTFSRTVTSGLGTAEIGGAWTVGGSAVTTSVVDGTGRISVGAARTNTYKLSAVATRDTDLVHTIWLEQMPSGGGASLWTAARSTASGDYRVRLNINPSGMMTAQLVKLVGSTETALTTSVSVPGTYAVNLRLRIRIQAFGASPTTIRAKIWQATNTEPTAWLASATDSTTGLQQAGSVGLASILLGNFSTSIIRIDDLVATERTELVTNP